jgi:site-specific recombinase XerD
MTFHHMKEGKYSLMIVEGKEAKEQSIKSYILHLVEKNTSTSQINMTICALRNFYEMNNV